MRLGENEIRRTTPGPRKKRPPEALSGTNLTYEDLFSEEQRLASDAVTASDKLRRARHLFKKRIKPIEEDLRRIEQAIDPKCAGKELELTRQALIVMAKRLMGIKDKIDEVMEKQLEGE